MGLTSGSKLGTYEIQAPLGAGGMGEVYRATDTKLGRDVALKVLPAEMAQDAERLARFRREAKVLAQLDHPNIVTIYSVEESEGVHFLTMQLVDGQPLNRLIAQDGLTIERIVEIGSALGEALAAAHEKGIVHRDLKPANVMVSSEGRVKVLDFGLAKDVRGSNLGDATLTSASHTEVGVVMGTPAYMSPEQTSGRPLDHRTDIFSLGVVLHEMATGRRPFEGTSSAELASSILRDNPPLVTDVRPELPSDLARIIRRCLEKDPRHRVQTARDVSNEFRDLARIATRPTRLSTSAARTAVIPDSGAARTDEGFWVAVLPFKYAGSNADLTALADGLTDDIITNLSRFSYLRVIARSCTASYSQAGLDVRGVAKELGARYVMEGSVRQAGTKVRIAVQLVDAASGAGLWAETYDRSFTPETTLDLLDDVVPCIVATVGDTQGIVAHSMTEALRNRDPESLTPYEALLRSFGFHQHVNAAEQLAGRTALERAVKQATDRADCWAMLSWLYRAEYTHGYNAQPNPMDRSLAAARRAVDLAPSNQLAQAALASAFFFRRELGSFRSAAERALALNRMEGYTTAFLGMHFAYSGDWERGCALAERATRLNPHHPGWYWLPMALNAYRQHEPGRALEFVLKVNMPGLWTAQIALAVIHSQAGEMERARTAVRDLLALRPDFAVTGRNDLEKWWLPDMVEQMLGDLGKAGLDMSGATAKPAPSSVAAPVRIAAEESRPAIRADEGFWVAVLPFKYKGSERGMEALAEGLTDEINTGLSRFSYLRVIARGSTPKYSSESGDVRAIGKELGARYVMEGSLRLSGNKLRLAVQLVDTASGAHLWAENYERAFSPDAMFELQDDLVPRIVSTVADYYGILPHTISDALRRKADDQLTPYEAVLRAFRYFERITPEEHAQVREILERAARSAPDQSEIWAMLSTVYWHEHAFGFNPQPDPLERALAAARRSIDAAPTNNLGHSALAATLFFQKNILAFRPAAERAIELNRMDGSNLATMGTMMAYSGDWEHGCALVESALQLTPHYPGWYWFAHFLNAYRKGDYRGALNVALKFNLPGYFLAHALTAAVYGQLGLREPAHKALQELLAIRPDFAAEARKELEKCYTPELVEHLIEGLRKAGLEIPDSHAAPCAATPTRAASGETRADEGFWVAVLPFKYAGKSDDLKALAEGLSEEVVTGLSRFSYLRVIARGSTAKYSGESGDVRAIGKELGARYVMEGSLRQAGSKLRLAVQLVDTASGAHLWAENYERTFSADAMFELQDDLVPRIVSTIADINGMLARHMSEAVRQRVPERMTPYEAVLRSFGYFERVTPEEMNAAIAGIESALQKAPTYADAWAMLALLSVQRYAQGFGPPADSLIKGAAAARKAVEAAPANHLAWFSLSQVLFFQKEFQTFRNAAERALALNPMDSNSLALNGEMLALSGEWERGVALGKRARELNPHHPGWYWHSDFNYAYRRRDYRAALEIASKMNQTSNWGAWALTAAACGQLGDRDGAARATQELLKLRPDAVSRLREDCDKWFDAEHAAHIMEGFRKAELDIDGGGSRPSPVTSAVASSSGAARAAVREDEGFWVAVLPFKYTGSSADLRALAEGLPEEIITGLSRFSYLRVIARGSTAKYSSESGDVRAIGKELGARYVMEGSLRQAGSKLRLAVQLADTVSGAHLWAETYERSFNPEAIFDLQDDLVPRIVSTAADEHGVLPHSMSELLRQRSDAKFTPHEAVLRAFSYFEHLTPEEHAEVREILEKAVAEAPSQSDCWAELSNLYWHEYALGFNPLPDSLNRAQVAARRAVEAAPSSYLAHHALAAALFFQKDILGFRREAERCIELNPLDGSTTAFMGILLAYTGEWERGCAIVERACQLNPNHPGWYYFAPFLNAYQKGDYSAALKFAVKIDLPTYQLSFAARAATFGQLGELERAKDEVRQLRAMRADAATSVRRELGKWYQPDLVRHWVEGLRKAGLEVPEADVTPSPAPVALAARTASGASRAEEGFWVAVLPFKYTGDGGAIKALAEGLSEEIITGLSRFSYLRVIARGSTAKYFSESGDVRAVGKELGARYVMEGTLRQAGNKLRLAVQLVEATSGSHLWAENYERSFRSEAVFELQDDLVPRIVSVVADQHGILPRSICAAVRKKDDDQITPYEAVFRVFGLHEKMTAQEHMACRELLERVVRDAPDAADCWAMLATLYADEDWFGFNLRPDPLGRAAAAAQRAAELAPASVLASLALAQSLFMRHEWQAFRPVAERTIALNPMDGANVAVLGLMLACSGDWERGCAVADSAMRLHPNFPGWYWLATVFNAYRTRDYRAALDGALRIQMPGYFWNSVTCAAAYGQLGEHDKAQKALRELLAARPNFAATARQELEKWFEPELGEHFLDGLRKAGLETAAVAVATASSSGATKTTASGATRADEGFWVAVLPFKYTGGNADLKALAEGLSEETITGLSRFSYLRVIARGSTAKYSSESGDVRAIGKELGARYVIEGSLRQAGSQLRLAVQLVDTVSGAHLWAETYEHAFTPESVFEVQDALVPRIVGTVADQYGVLPRSMSEVLRSKNEDTLTPHEAVLRTFSYFTRITAEEHSVIRRILERTVREAPDHADSWAMLSMIYRGEFAQGYNAQPNPLDRALAAAQRAVDLAPTHPLGYYSLAAVHFFRKEKVSFRVAAERALALNPLDASVKAYMGMLIAVSGEWDRGCQMVEAAMQLNPNCPGYFYSAVCCNAYRQGKYEEALEAVACANMPNYFHFPAMRAAILGQLGRHDEARKAVQDLLALRPDFGAAARQEYAKWYDPDLVEGMIDGLRKAGLEIPDEKGSPVLTTVASGSSAKPDSGVTRAALPEDEGFWVAVPQFKYTGSNADLKALAEGLSEEVVTGLSRFSYLHVIARGSTAKYAGESGDVRIGKELGARYVMEGSIRQAGPTLRISVQLVDAVTGAHLWAETYERTFRAEDLFELQDDLVPRIVSTVADAHGVLPRTMSQAVSSKSLAELTPYEALLRTLTYAERISPEEHAIARDAAEHAVQLAPNYSKAWAVLATIYVGEYGHFLNPQPQPLERALKAAQRAVDLDPSNSGAHAALALVLFFRKQFQAFRIAAEQALELNPYAAAEDAVLGLCIAYSGDWERGCAVVERAMQINPRLPGWVRFAAFYNAYRKHDYQGAIRIGLKFNLPNLSSAHSAMAAAYAQAGDLPAAQKELQELRRLMPNTADAVERFRRWQLPEMAEHLIEGLRKAGLEIPEVKKESQKDNGKQTSSGTVSGGVVAAGQSIAVLPFANMSEDKEQDYFSDGLAEEIINLLAQIPALKVIARTSAFAFRGKEEDIRGIAEALGVRTVLEGSVRRAGSRIRVTAQLINAADGSHLWSERYDRELSDIFAVQDEISAAIAKALRVKLSREAAPQRYTPKVEAYEAYLKGRYQQVQVTPESLELARHCYEQAIELDPNFAMAHLGLGYYWFILTHFGRRPADECLPAARVAMQRALQMDPSLPEAHAFLGYLAAMYEGDWATGEREFDFPLAKQASFELLRPTYGGYLYLRGDAEQAIKLAQRAIEEDPLDVWAHMNLHAYLQAAGRDDEALEQLKNVIELDPNHVVALVSIVMICADKGELAEALKIARRAYAVGPWFPDTVGLLAALLRREGEEEESRSIAKELGSGESLGDARARALFHLVCGEIDQGADWVEKALEQRDSSMRFYLHFVICKGLRASHRWGKIAKMVNLPVEEQS